LLDYAGLEREYGFETLEKQLKELNALAKRSFSNSQLITVLKWANKNKSENWEALKELVKTLPPSATAENIATALEDSIKLVDLARAKEDKNKWESE
jgi:Tfp pilus assembly protein PilN